MKLKIEKYIKNWFFGKKIKKIHSRKTDKKKKMQIIIIKNEMANITTNQAVIKKIMRKYCNFQLIHLTT